MARKIHKITALLDAAKAISEKYNFKIENYILEVSVSLSKKEGLNFWIKYNLDEDTWTEVERIFGFGQTPEDALIMWEEHIREFLKLAPIKNINKGDFIF